MHLLYFSVCFLSALTLMAELLLTRVFDVIMTPNMSYLVITCVMFSFGLAGVYISIRPVGETADPRLLLSRVMALFALSVALIHPVINRLPFDYEQIFSLPLLQVIYFVCLYFILVLPFFFTGLFIAITFSNFVRKIQVLYFFDLTGAAIGCVVFIPFLPHIGPAGLLYVISGVAFLISGLLSGRRLWNISGICLAVILAALPVVKLPEFYDFIEHTDKRGIKTARRENLFEFSRWDPISKIDVLGTEPHQKHIAYDGGTQSSHFFRFDGDYQKLRTELLIHTTRHVWNKGVIASHYLRKDTRQNVLIIGSAGGQETKVALAYGAARIDAVEMVGTVVELGKGKYAEYIGRIFHDPRVNTVIGEGRSYLRSTDARYDIIQIFSNHTSSSIASGTGAMATTYLQTADAYREYFNHLSDEGILHINHHIYPRMIAVAAKAWRELGRENFREHVLVYQKQGGEDNLPTFLVKMSPWTREEVETLNGLFTKRIGRDRSRYALVENALNDDEHFLPPEFFSGSLPKDVISRADYHVFPSTDDRPYFNFLRKSFKYLAPDKGRFVNDAVASVMNSRLRNNIIPMDVIHFLVVGIIAILFALVCILAPLMFSRAGKSPWNGKGSVLGYFSCLGAGFIIFELVLIQLFMKLIGFPLYVYSTVIFTLLLAAGCGSIVSARLHLERSNMPYHFMGVVIFACAVLAGHNAVINIFLQTPLPVRILASAGMIFPLGFFLGMPFPLGMLTLEKQPRGSIAWAWGMNSLFTVIGGLASIILSIFIGFRMTMVIALALYLIAFRLYTRMRSFAV